MHRRSEAADFLGDLDDVAAYWEIPLEEPAEDPMAVPRALGLIARSQNMSELARRVGVSRGGLKRPRPPASPPVPSHSPPPSDPTTSAPTSADH